MTIAERDLNADLTAVMGEGTWCAWQPGIIPTSGRLLWSRLLDLLISDALEEAGFDRTAVVTQEPCGSRRRLELWGPDSPAEWSWEFEPVKRENTVESMKAARKRVLKMRTWILERGRAYAALMEQEQ